MGIKSRFMHVRPLPRSVMSMIEMEWWYEEFEWVLHVMTLSRGCDAWAVGVAVDYGAGRGSRSPDACGNGPEHRDWCSRGACHGEWYSEHRRV